MDSLEGIAVGHRTNWSVSEMLPSADAAAVHSVHSSCSAELLIDRKALEGVLLYPEDTDYRLRLDPKGSL